VLHRLAKTEVDPERQRGNELGQPNWRRFGVAGRPRAVGRSLRERSLGSHDGTREPATSGGTGLSIAAPESEEREQIS
jgi:hypothetical protein